MGVCCIVFDIDGMLFDFVMNFLNIEKNKIYLILFSIFQVFFAFHAVSNIKKKNWCKKKKIRGGGCGFCCSYFTFYAIFNTYWLNGRWFLQIVERDSWNLYPLFPCSDFVSQMWGWFGGGGGV